MARPESHERIAALEAAAAHGADAQTRFRWRVRDCVFCSWRPLRELYSVTEMWQLLRQGRFAKAMRIASARNKD